LRRTICLSEQKQREFPLDQISGLKKEQEMLLDAVVSESPAQYSSGDVISQPDEQSKIELFRSLSRGSEDAYPRRFESRKTGKSGYQPHCGNEWIAGVCGKP
jgi:hypothetical protein